MNAVQVLQEAVQGFGKVDMRVAQHERAALDPRALENVRQRQVGQLADLHARAHGRADVVGHAFAGRRDALEAVHHALGRAGGARGVDQHRQFAAGALRPARQGLVARDDVVPALELGRRRQRKGDAWQPGGNALGLLRPLVELADEQQAGAAVLEPEAHGGGGLGRKDRHRGAAGHPDRDLGTEEMGAVLGQDGDAKTAFEVARLQVCCHAPRLVHHLAPAVVDHLARADGLGQVDSFGVRCLVPAEGVEDQLLLRHDDLLCCQ